MRLLNIRGNMLLEMLVIYGGDKWYFENCFI